MDPASRDVLCQATGRLAHEIKNSLTGIVGALEVLRDRVIPSAHVDDVLARVDAEIRRIGSSVHELEKYAARHEAVFKRTQLRDIIEQSLERAALRATTKIARRYRDDMPPVAADPKLLGEAIQRILVNAEEAMPEGGTLTVSTSWDRDRALIRIRDTGPGIPAGELDRVFEPFFTNKMRGLGLGLAISRTLVDAHGGTLSAVSPDGGGTELVIVLPHQS